MPAPVTPHLSPEQIVGVDGVALLADGRLGFWPVVGACPEATAAIDVVQASGARIGTARPARDNSGAGGSVEVVTIKATVVPVGAAVDALLSIDASQPVRPSVAAASAVARLVVGAVAAGRAAPVLTDERYLTWTVGPWTTRELDQLHHLATTLPPELRATPIDPAPIDPADKEPRRAGLAPDTLWVRTAGATVTALADAIAESIIAGPASFTTLGRHGLAVGLRPDELDPDRLCLLRNELLGEGPILSARLVVDDGARLELDVRSRQDHTVRLPASAIWADPDAAATLGPERPDEWLIAQLSLLARTWPPFQRLLGEQAPAVLHLTDDEFEDLLLHRVDELRRIGLEVLLPKELVRRLELSARARSIPGESGTSIGAFSLGALVDTRIVASIDGVPLTDEELALLADANRQIVRIRDQFVRVDPRLAGRLQRRLGTGEALAAGLTGTVDFDGEMIPLDLDDAPELASFIDRLRAVRSTTEADPAEADDNGGHDSNDGDRVEIPGLEAELRHYQVRGVRWLTQLADLTGGGILADDMGLGKTLQLLALHQIRTARAEQRAESRPGPTLVVGPSSLVANWDREAAKFCPKTQVHRYHGPDRTLDGVENDDIVVTSYAILRRDQAILGDRLWDLVIADEAQHVKNHRSVTAHALRTVPAAVRLAVTGTPVENSLIDLWSLIDWSLPGLLGGITAFKRRTGGRHRRVVDRRTGRRLAAGAGRGGGPMSRPRAGNRAPSTRRGAKVTGRRDLAKTWWSQEWIASLEERAIRNPNRLGRGRTYARRGAVEEMTITEGAVDALVAGSRPRPYRVVISIQVFSDDEWDAVVELIASQVGFQARFQAGEVPEELVAAASDIGIELFPLAGELTMACSCPDTALPCKHLAAVFYQVAGALDEDPFRILLLRGAEREVIDRRLREARASAATRVDSTLVGIEPAIALYAGIDTDGEGAGVGTGDARRAAAELSGDSGQAAFGSNPMSSTTISLPDRGEQFLALGPPGRLLLADLEVAARRAARHLSDGEALTPVPDPMDWATAPDLESPVPSIVDAAERIAGWEHDEALAAELGAALGWTEVRRRSIIAAWDAAGPQAVAVTEAVRTGAWKLDQRQADLAAELLSSAGGSVRRYKNWLTLTGQNRRLVAEPGRGGEWWWLLEPRARHWVTTRRLHVDELPDSASPDGVRVCG